MSRLRGLAVAVAIALALGLAGAVAAAAAPAQLVDCLAADVDGRPVTRVDVLLAERLGLFEPPPEGAVEDQGARRRRVLDHLVSRVLVLSMARQQIRVEEAEIDAAEEALNRRLGPDHVRAAARDFGLAGGDIRNLLRDGLLFDKIVALRFSQPPVVSLKEIEAYYQNTYLPEVRERGGAPESLIEMLDRIEARLREARRAEQSAAWLRDLRGQADVRIRADCLR